MEKTSLLKTTLGNYYISVTPESHQSHIILRVEVPRTTQEIVIQYSYSPTEENAEDRLDQLFSRYQKDNNMAASDRAHIQSVRNLITVSVSSSQGYEGSCHRFESTGRVVINNSQSSPGIQTREVSPGFWDISFNFHALVTAKTEIHCTIDAIHKEERSTTQPIEIAAIKKERFKRERYLNAQTCYKKVELHTHTHHSDARHTTEELINDAIKQKIDWLAITDHNTISAFDKISPENYPLQFIKGLEMTTLHGHFLTLGYQDKPPMDWTLIDRVNINEKLAEMKEQGLLIGIAHPFDVGSPYCTGCRWQYALESLEWIDFIEVWNSEDPHESLSNADAIAKWTQLLNAGIEIPVTCGRDWHHSNTTKLPAFLYTAVKETSSGDDILEAVKLGRSYISLSPQIDLTINGQWTIGDRIHFNEFNTLMMKVHLTDTEDVHAVKIESNLGDLYEGHHKVIHQLEKSEVKDLIWLRISVFDQHLNRILITNPVYFTD
ncbi:CehA/McbA family metallohydrolase [Neobacillus sp. 19]|uniref:CehA/McbA family metallohydrolase n=1 Tax=Neobacillus sp. 19 TaxID=3394458 RepID=UPI003BF69814